jgi:hypothetical protein
MAIKETPTGIRVYYKSMIAANTLKRSQLISSIDTLEDSVFEEKRKIEAQKDIYKRYNIDLDKYAEYKNNTYLDGTFLKVANGAFMNKSNDYEVVSELFDLLKFAKLQKEIHDTKHELSICDRCLDLSLNDYIEVFRTFYTEVHKAMILQGYGYRFEEPIGWICVNRCKLINPRPHIDYALTKQKRRELKNAGKKVYNKDEAEWCKKNNIEYDAEHDLVFRTNEYCYEIPLIGCQLENGSLYEFQTSDYRHASVRGKTNKQLSEECNNDIAAICDLKVDMRTKLNMCVEVDKTLYLNFIRNANQKPLTAGKTSGQNR